MAYFRCTTGGSGKGNTLVVTCADDLAGATITCTDGTKTYRKTCPNTAPYEVTFYGLEAGTWTVSTTVSGSTYSTTVVITDYEAELGGFSWRAWVDLSQNYTSSDFTDLDDLLSDETAIRELMTIHACVDYLADIAATSADVETIIGNDLCAKWINLRDYALDTLYANEIIADYMDTADKYGYGEWALVGQVPKMTSNSAPYGTASASSIYSSTYDAYKAFDGGNPTTSGVKGWLPSNGNIVGEKVYYNFASACKISKARVYWIYDGQARPTIKAKIVGSNDGSTWSAELSDEFTITDNGWVDVDCDTSNSYSYVGFVITSGDSNIFSTGGVKIQFYAWAPKGNVPVMTSNSAPYGSANASSAYSGQPAYYAFDGNDSTAWVPAAGAGTNAILYWNPVVPVRATKIKYRSDNARPTSIEIQGYNSEGDYHQLALVSPSGTGDQYFDLSGDIDYYAHYCLIIRAISDDFPHVNTLQFYGRELSVSVPKMDTNTTPYGEVIVSGSYNSCYPYCAFDNSTSSYWQGSEGGRGDGNGEWIGYHFVSKIKPKLIDIYGFGYSAPSDIFYAKIQGSNDGTTWVDVTEKIQLTNRVHKYIVITDIPEYEYLRAIALDSSITAFGMVELQFYGLDYSEKEFEEGTTRKWLYDHGVELETVTAYKEGSTSTVEKEPNGILCETKAANDIAEAYFADSIDFSNYSLLRAKVGEIYTNYAFFYIVSTVPYTYTKWVNDQDITARVIPYTPLSSPNTISLDVSNINASAKLLVGVASSSAVTRNGKITELWLE